MSFDPEWLRLREPVDHAARAGLLERVLAGTRRGHDPLRVADLGCGSGSNLRHLAPRLGGRQHWHLIDTDPALLERVPKRLREWAGEIGWAVAETGEDPRLSGPDAQVTVQRHRADLSASPLPVPDVDLVTGAALLDLVSADWLERLAARCAEAGAAALFVLSYDGRISWTPEDAFDAPLRTLVNRHQRSDKSFGPALGPDAHEAARAAFERHGFSVEDAASDWRLGPDDAALQQHLHAGWVAAACEIAPNRAEAVQAWLARRMDLLAAGTSEVTVGHMDLLALPGA